jgi:hypothetical protein
MLILFLKISSNYNILKKLKRPTFDILKKIYYNNKCPLKAFLEVLINIVGSSLDP